MVGVAKRLRPRIVVPVFVGSNPITHPMKNSDVFTSEFFSYIRLRRVILLRSDIWLTPSDIALRATLEAIIISLPQSGDIAFAWQKYHREQGERFHLLFGYLLVYPQKSKQAKKVCLLFILEARCKKLCRYSRIPAKHWEAK